MSLFSHFPDMNKVYNANLVSRIIIIIATKKCNKNNSEHHSRKKISAPAISWVI